MTQYKKTLKFINEWKDHKFVSSTEKTPEFKSFARKFKNVIKEQVDECFDIVNYSVGHFEISTFLKHKESGKFLYVSISDVRFFQKEWINHVLYRTAEHEKDYRGGMNQYIKLENLHKLCH